VFTVTTTTTVKTLAIRNSAEELMISRRAQLKGQDQKVSSLLTDDFTMRNFIAVSPLSFIPTGNVGSHISSFPLPLPKNPSFMQEAAYEPLILDALGKDHRVGTCGYGCDGRGRTGFLTRSATANNRGISPVKEETDHQICGVNERLSISVYLLF
jgi:hypothetical protein